MLIFGYVLPCSTGTCNFEVSDLTSLKKYHVIWGITASWPPHLVCLSLVERGQTCNNSHASWVHVVCNYHCHQYHYQGNSPRISFPVTQLVKNYQLRSHRVSAWWSVVLSLPSAGRKTVMNYQLVRLELISVIVWYEVVCWENSPVGDPCGDNRIVSYRLIFLLRSAWPPTGVSRARSVPESVPENGGVQGSLPSGPGLGSVQKVSRECLQSVQKVSQTLWEHSRDTVWTLESRGPEGPQGHRGTLPWTAPFSWTLSETLRGTLWARRARDSCGGPGASPILF